MTKLPPLDELLRRVDSKTNDCKKVKGISKNRYTLLSLDSEATEVIYEINPQANMYEVLIFHNANLPHIKLAREACPDLNRKIYETRTHSEDDWHNHELYRTYLFSEITDAIKNIELFLVPVVKKVQQNNHLVFCHTYNPELYLATGIHFSEAITSTFLDVPQKLVLYLGGRLKSHANAIILSA